VVPGGYDQVIARLVADCAAGGVRIIREMVVRSVTWRKGSVTVLAHDLISGTPRHYAGRASVVALPLGVLKARGGTGAVRFHPALKDQQRAIDGMQMGHVFRISMRFRRAAWRRMMPDSLARLRHFGFIHAAAKDVPVWWSLSDMPVLVGWAGGPSARRLLRLTPAMRLRRALGSLAEVLGVAPGIVRKGLSDWQAKDWTNDFFSRGAYSFTAAGQDDSGAVLRRSSGETLFFAGEATATGSEVGTVHGALASGLRAGRQAARALRRRRR
jgi:monoamine oxidase